MSWLTLFGAYCVVATWAHLFPARAERALRPVSQLPFSHESDHA